MFKYFGYFYSWDFYNYLNDFAASILGVLDFGYFETLGILSLGILGLGILGWSRWNYTLTSIGAWFWSLKGPNKIEFVVDWMSERLKNERTRIVLYGIAWKIPQLRSYCPEYSQPYTSQIGFCSGSIRLHIQAQILQTTSHIKKTVETKIFWDLK